MKKLFANFLYFMGSYMLYEKAQVLTTDQVWLKITFLKVIKQTPYQNRWRHLAENFQKRLQIFCSLYTDTIDPYKDLKAEFWNCA